MCFLQNIKISINGSNPQCNQQWIWPVLSRKTGTSQVYYIISIQPSNAFKQIEIKACPVDNHIELTNVDLKIKRKNSDGDEHSSAFKHILADQARARSKSFSECKSPITRSPIFHPIIVTSDLIYICSNKLCNKPCDGKLYAMSKSTKAVYCCECFELFRKEQYCYYCYQIYQDTANINAVVDGLDWIECEHCSKWVYEC